MSYSKEQKQQDPDSTNFQNKISGGQVNQAARDINIDQRFIQPISVQGNQSAGQIYGGLVVYVSGGQAIINSQKTENSESEMPTTQIEDNPYKGLQSFYENDKSRYFGRSAQIKVLLSRFKNLCEGENTIRLLPVFGPSGSGKSSLVRAGLIPALAEQPFAGLTQARVTVLKPETQPLLSLAKVLARIAENDISPVKKTREFAEELALISKDRTYDGLHRIAQALPESETFPLIVVIDQFEEIYSLCHNPEERNIFVENLLYAAHNYAKHVSVVLTMRSDFVRETHQHPKLGFLLSQQGFLVPPMDERALQEAISQPAKNAGHPLDESTIQLLIEQTIGRNGALPMLQFALTQIWEGLSENKSPAQTLESIGGVGGALAGEAQRVYESLNINEQEITQRVFLGLIQLGEGTRDTRRRSTLGELITRSDNERDFYRVIEKFTAPSVRLITILTDEDKQAVELTHEALLDHWALLREWLASSRDDLRFQRRLQDAVERWEEQGCPKGSLWRPPDLTLLEKFHDREKSALTSSQFSFLQASQQDGKMRNLIRNLGISSLIASFIFVGLQLQKSRRQQVEQLAKTAEALSISQPAESEINAIASLGLGKSFLVRFPPHPISYIGENSLLKAMKFDYETNNFDYSQTVYSVDFSPNGNHVVTGNKDKTVRIWDSITGEPNGSPLEGHNAPVNSVKFSPNGRRVVSLDKAGEIRVWDISTHSQVLETIQLNSAAEKRKSKSWVVTFSPDGNKIISGHGSKILFFDAVTGESLDAFSARHSKGDIEDFSFSPNGQILASAGGNEVRFWNMESGAQYGQVIKKSSDVYSLIFSPDGKRVITGHKDASIRIWDIETGQEVGKPLLGHDNAVWSLNITPDGRRIISSSGDNTLRLWSVLTGEQLGPSLKGHEDAVYSISLSPDGERIVSGGSEAGNDRTIRVWDIGYKLFEKPFYGHSDSVYSVVSSLDGEKVASGGRDETVIIWDVASGNAETILTGKDAFNSVAFSPDGNTIAAGGSDAIVTLWDSHSGQEASISPLRGHRESIRTVAFHPDGKRLITGSEDQTIGVWNFTTGERERILEGHEGFVYSVAVHPEGTIIASSSTDGSVRLWNSDTGELIRKIDVADNTVRKVTFSNDGQRMASADTEGNIKVWSVSVESLEEDLTINHGSDKTSVAFSPDGDLLISTGSDRTIKLWSSQTGKQVGRTLIPHSNTIFSANFTGDGQNIISGSGDHSVRLLPVSWFTSAEELLNMSCERLGNHASLRFPKNFAAIQAKKTCHTHTGMR